MEKFNSNLCDSSNHIALMSVYRTEWAYRDKLFMQTFWRFVYLSFIITFLPIFLQSVNVTESFALKLPIYVFSIMGIVCAVFGWIYGVVENTRIASIDIAYKNIRDCFPDKFCPEEFSPASILKFRWNNILCGTVYSVIIILAILNILFEYFFVF